MNTNTYILEVPKLLHPYVDAAVARLSYILPELDFAAESGIIRILSAQLVTPQIRSEVMYALYREKISADSTPLQKQMFEALFS
jgi:hypothetical protein